jgi:hypothetical protein
MPSKRVRPEQYKGWPEDKRENYIRLFSLQERLRAHLKMAQELAVRNYRLKYDTNPRKTNPIRIASRPDDYLRRYREDQWPEIRGYLKHISQEIQIIKAAYKGGRHPKWYEAIGMVENLAGQILDKMEMIQVQLIVTLRSNGHQSIKESNQAIIDETAKVLILARDLREILLFVPLDRAKIGLDDYGFEAILDLSKPHIMDLSTIWQHQSRAKNKRG